MVCNWGASSIMLWFFFWTILCCDLEEYYLSLYTWTVRTVAVSPGRGAEFSYLLGVLVCCKVWMLLSAFRRIRWKIRLILQILNSSIDIDLHFIYLLWYVHVAANITLVVVKLVSIIVGGLGYIKYYCFLLYDSEFIRILLCTLSWNESL